MIFTFKYNVINFSMLANCLRQRLNIKSKYCWAETTAMSSPVSNVIVGDRDPFLILAVVY